MNEDLAVRCARCHRHAYTWPGGEESVDGYLCPGCVALRDGRPDNLSAQVQRIQALVEENAALKEVVLNVIERDAAPPCRGIAGSEFRVPGSEFKP